MLHWLTEGLILCAGAMSGGMMITMLVDHAPRILTILQHGEIRPGAPCPAAAALPNPRAIRVVIHYARRAAMPRAA